MGWLGKAIGGSIGLFVGGPIGAIFGAVIGHQFDKNGQSTGGFTKVFSPQERSQAVFFVSAFSMAAKLARADGRVTKEEINIVDDFIRNQLRLDNDARDMAIKIFNVARNSREPFDVFAQQFYELFRQDRQMLMTMLELLIKIATADGTIHSEEEKMIRRAAVIFYIDQNEFGRLKDIYIKNNDKYYAVLGASQSDSDDEIKKKYRKLVMEYHPDRVIAKGLPEEFTKFANKKFQEIHEAYEKVMKERQAA